MSAIAQKENSILEVYKKNVDLRIFLLEVDFNVLLNEDFLDRMSMNFSNRSKEDLLVFVQLSIISKIMMMIEDFVVLSISYMEEKNFYDLLLSKNTQNLGDTIGEFIDKLPKLDHHEIIKIMSWIDIN